MQRDLAGVIEEVKKVIVGKDDIIKKVLLVITAGGHLLLEDVPGVGKTTMALGFSKALDLRYRRVQFTPDTMASDITGFSIYDKQTQSLQFKEGAAFCNLFLADEINRTSARTQAALLETMEERTVTVDGITHPLPDPFIVIATQNPVGSAGTSMLPESQLDRFMVRLSMGYPDVESQIEMVKQRAGADPLETLERRINLEQLVAIRTLVHALPVHDDVVRYAAELCAETGRPDAVEVGVSPRAVLALIELAKAQAFIEERNYVTPEDIQDFFVDVCAHRLVLSARARVQKTSVTQVLLEVLSAVKVPSLSKA